MMLALAFALGLECFAQKNEPMLKRGDYSVEDIKAFALKNSKKGREFSKELISLVQRRLNEAGINVSLSKENIPWIFEHTKIQEAALESGQFMNSRWLPDEERIEFFESETRYEGNVGIFVYNEDGKHFSFPLFKASCANLLDVIALKNVPVETAHNILVPDTVYPDRKKPDTIYKILWVVSPQAAQPCQVVVASQCNYCESGYMYYPQTSFYSPWLSMSFGWSSYGGYGVSNITYNNIYNDNSSYYNNVTTINNERNNWRNERVSSPPGGRVTPPPHIDPPGGGPITPPPHTDLPGGRGVIPPPHADQQGGSRRTQGGGNQSPTYRQPAVQQQQTYRTASQQPTYRQPATQQQPTYRQPAPTQTFRSAPAPTTYRQVAPTNSQPTYRQSAPAPTTYRQAYQSSPVRSSGTTTRSSSFGGGRR